MSTKTDWQLSLEGERKYWLYNKDRTCSEWWLGIKKGRADKLKHWVTNYKPPDQNSMILQVGAAGEGMINFLGIGHRHAIDPLARFFKAEFSSVLDPSVAFCAGIGEKLPYRDATFDLVIIYNALDHTFDPQLVLSEMNRILKTRGICHIAVHRYSIISNYQFKLIRYLQKSKQHPWTFSYGAIMKELRDAQFEVLDVRYGGKDESKIPDWFDRSLKWRLARLIGLQVPMLHILATKRSTID